MLAHLKSTLYESYPVMPVSMKKYANSVGVLFKEGWGWGLGCDPVGWSKWKSQKVALWYRELLLHCIHLLYLEINCCHRLYSSHPDAIPAMMIMYSLSPVKALLIDAGWCWLMLIDYDWCWLVLIDYDWCWLVLIDYDWCCEQIQCTFCQPNNTSEIRFQNFHGVTAVTRGMLH